MKTRQEYVTDYIRYLCSEIDTEPDASEYGIGRNWEAAKAARDEARELIRICP